MKIALIVNDDFSAWHFRQGLIRALIGRGIQVTVISPDGPYVSRIKALGARHVVVPVYRFVSPFRDLKLCWNLFRVLRQEKPDIVHTITAKPNIYGTLAARLSGVRHTVSLVSGLGYAFSEVSKNWRTRLVCSLVPWLYWLSGKLSTATWFQNRDDLELFVSRRLLASKKAVLIPGSGINLQEYSVDRVSSSRIARLKQELGIPKDRKVVLMMVARLSWSKGVREFAEAAKQLSLAGCKSHFLLVGPLDPDSPDPVPESYLTDPENTGPQFKWVGFRDDGRELVAMSDVVTLPSFYREGIPRVLLEAMALRKPIVTTNNVGCKEVVDDGVNGYLVPIESTPALAKAIRTVLDDDDLARAMGLASRQKVEREFDERLVITRVFNELYLLPSTETVAAKAA